jgi:hybrid cluster-associated redox disulfide protein
MPITGEMKIADVVNRHPATAAVFRSHRMECLSCKGSRQESIDSCALLNGIEPSTLLRELNRAAAGSKG